MRLKILKNFFVTTACILFITLTLMFVITSFVLNGYITDMRREMMEKTVDQIGQLVTEAPDDTELLVENIKTVSKINEIEVFVANNKGQMVLCFCDEFEQNSACEHTKLPIDTEYLSGVGGDTSFSVSTMNGRFSGMRYVSAKRLSLGSAGEERYLFATASTFTVAQMLSLLFRIYAVSAVIPLLIMFVVEYIMTYRLAKPLKYMSAAARSIAKGDYSKRIPVMSEDEIGELSVLFNRMTDSLSKTESVRRSFISNVSHELKTPMTTIGGFIDGIIDGTIDESRRDYYLKIVSEEVKRLSRLVTSMLNVTRLESDELSLQPSEFDFAELVLTAVVTMEQKITDKNLSVEGLEDLSHTLITADKDLVFQVVYNLVDNAVKYSAEGGYIRFSSHRIGDEIVFNLKNDGEGIAKEDLPYVFDRFYKADKSRSGNKDSLGLGLYITKTIVDLHEGEIAVKSEKGVYTEFKVTLPVNKREKSKNNKNIRGAV